MKIQRSKQGRTARLKPQESASWIKFFCIACRVVYAYKSLYTLVFVLLARRWAGTCVTASMKAFGDFLKKSSMELQIFEKVFLDESSLCCTCVSLPPLPDDRVSFKLL